MTADLFDLALLALNIAGIHRLDLELGLDDPVIEQDFEPLPDEATAVWGDEHPAPSNTGPAHEREVCRWLDQSARRQLDALAPTDKGSLEQFISKEEFRKPRFSSSLFFLTYLQC